MDVASRWASLIGQTPGHSGPTAPKGAGGRPEERDERGLVVAGSTQDVSGPPRPLNEPAAENPVTELGARLGRLTGRAAPAEQPCSDVAAVEVAAEELRVVEDEVRVQQERIAQLLRRSESERRRRTQPTTTAVRGRGGRPGLLACPARRAAPSRTSAVREGAGGARG